MVTRLARQLEENPLPPEKEDAAVDSDGLDGDESSDEESDSDYGEG
jgi:hypothetical protein